MSEEEEKALKYFYLKSKKQLKSVKIKGLAYKSCFQFVKTIKGMASKLNQIHDLEEVLSYED